MVAEIVTVTTLALASIAEQLHWKRCRRIAPLAFGPKRRPQPWVYTTPFLRIIALGLLAWGLATLLVIPPKVFKSELPLDQDPRHAIIVLDVSPSMKLQDAGSDLKQSRARRASDLMESFYRRVQVDRLRWTVVAVYNGAKPVVVDTHDLEVVRNIFDDLPLNHVFDVGKTQIFDGLKEAAKIAQPWKLGSTTLILISDGDTVSETGMPPLPPSISDVLVLGVGDPHAGKFIDGHMSRQDASTLRQTAARLKGIYHDGNQKQIPTETLLRLMGISTTDSISKLTRREFALIAVCVGAITLAVLPIALMLWGVRWRPGVRSPLPIQAGAFARS